MATQVGPVRHLLYVHLVWTTRGRERLIDPDLARFLCRFLRAMARKERAHVLEIGMVQTHVHLLARLHPTVPVSTLVKRLKGASSAVAAQEELGSQGRLSRTSAGSQPTIWMRQSRAGKGTLPNMIRRVRRRFSHNPVGQLRRAEQRL